jgi:hypothetical protein
MTDWVQYHRGDDMQLVDLLDLPGIAEDADPAQGTGKAVLPEPALLYIGQDRTQAPRLIQPWASDDQPGIKLHFAIYPAVAPHDVYDVMASLTVSLWESYRQSPTGLPDRINQLARYMRATEGNVAEAGRRSRVANVIAYMQAAYFTRTEGRDRTWDQDIATNFIVKLVTGDTGIPFEKNTGCDHRYWTVFVAHVPSIHAALCVARRLACSKLMLKETRTPRLLIPVTDPAPAYAVISPAAAGGKIVDALIWQQLPLWREGIRLTLAAGDEPALLNAIVHVLPPHVRDHRLALVDGERVNTQVKRELLFGDMPPPERDIATLAKIAADKPTLVAKKNKGSGSSRVTTSPRSTLKAKLYIEASRRTYAPRQWDKLGDAYAGPMTLAVIQSGEQKMAQQYRAPKVDKTTTWKAKKAKGGKEDPKADAKSMRVDEMFKLAAAKRPRAEADMVAIPTPVVKKPRLDLRNYFGQPDGRQ